MAITYPQDYFLGAHLLNPRVAYKKIKELIDVVNGVRANVTQLTNITTGVTLNATKGVITTVALTNAAGVVTGPFTVTNSKVTSSSVIMASVEYATGKTGAPYVIVEGVTNGLFKLKIANGGSAVLNDVVKVHIVVIN